MRSFSGEFHEEPWVELSNWGRGVRVRSTADLDVVRRFIDDKRRFRRAVVFENLTARRRRELGTAIEELGVQLRELTDSDKAAMAVRTTGLKDMMYLWVGIALVSPILLVRRLQGRTTKVFEISRPSSPSTDGA